MEGDLHSTPQPSPETEVFWNAAQEGRFLIKACNACGKYHWYPRAICPLCFHPDTEWREASGQGTIYSFSVTRKAAQSYVLAYVTLDEGPTMMTNIIDCDPDDLAIGKRVRVAFSPREGGPPAPAFRLQ